MSMAVMQQLTLEEFLKLPEEKPALEFEEGRIIQKVSPKARHSSIQGDLVQFFNRSLRSRRLARAFPELRATFGGRSYVPDVSVIRWDRIPRASDGTIADDFFAPPDIAVEIVSPEQSVNALVRRCVWYVENGVRAALLVDPQDQSIVVFRPGMPPVPFSGAGEIDLSDLLPDLRLSVQEVFSALKVD